MNLFHPNYFPKAPPPSIAERIRASAHELWRGMNLPFRMDQRSPWMTSVNSLPLSEHTLPLSPMGGTSFLSPCISIGPVSCFEQWHMRGAICASSNPWAFFVLLLRSPSPRESSDQLQANVVRRPDLTTWSKRASRQWDRLVSKPAWPNQFTLV